jgi:hypothetical protein
MAALFFLALGLACTLVGRILLASAAFGISVWWGLGVFLPFGPVLFRMNYPDLAPASRRFRVAALPCLLMAMALGPGVRPAFHHDHYKIKQVKSPGAPAGYAMETTPRRASSSPAKSAPVNLVKRAAALDKEFERLASWSEKLRLEKRDLLHSDVEGNRAFDLELAQYNAALAKANAEKSALAAAVR